MNTENLAIALLRESEREYAAKLADIRRSIDILLSHETQAANKSTADIIMSTLKSNTPAKRTYNTTNRNSGTSALDKIADTILRTGRFLHKVEIEAILNDGVNVSPILSAAKTKGTRNIVNYKPGETQNQITWGFADWIGNDGKPKPQYMYDEAFVMSRK